MLEWMKRRAITAFPPSPLDIPRAKPEARGVRGPRRPLYEYLEKRYAETVVLTFDEIEDLLGSALPAVARLDGAWWAGVGDDAADAGWSECWTLARRTAAPNMPARNVAFERAP